MAVKIRLARAGRKSKPHYHIVAAVERAPRDGRFKEKLGYYNPLLAKSSPERVIFDRERVDYWLSVGAKPTVVVARLLRAKNPHAML